MKNVNTIPRAIEKDILRGIGAPKVIASDAQNERYISALLELEHRACAAPRTPPSSRARRRADEGSAVSAPARAAARNYLTAAERNFAELLTLLIEAYEEKQHPIRAAPPTEVLAELMAANNLRQKDLAPLLGSESVVSEVLSGKRELNKRHIVELSRLFKVSSEVFF